MSVDRPDSNQVIKDLLLANIDVKMITGDSLGTACYVSNLTHIINYNVTQTQTQNYENILILSHNNTNNQFYWNDINNNFKYYYNSISNSNTISTNILIQTQLQSLSAKDCIQFNYIPVTTGKLLMTLSILLSII